MNRENLRTRAKQLEAEVQAKTADLEAGTVTHAEYREFVDKAFSETTEIKETLETYQKAASMSGAAEVNPGGPAQLQEPEPREMQEAVPMTRKEFSLEYLKLKHAARNRIKGNFAFELGLKADASTQGAPNLMGENAFGTTAGVPLVQGEYFLPGTAGPDIPPTFVPGILELRWYDNVVASLFSTFPTESPTVTYVRETNWTNNAAPTNEGGVFPYSTNNILRLNAQVGKVANAIKLTDEEIQDSRYFLALAEKRCAMGVSRQEEVQILAGAGFPGVEGLLSLSTQFTQPQTVAPVSNLVWPTASTPGLGAIPVTISSVTPGRAIVGSGGQAVSGSQLAIGIFAMLTDIRVTHFFEPTAIVMNPVDWFTLRTWQDANGQFMAGSPWLADYGNNSGIVKPEVYAVDPQLGLWGKRVVTTPAIPQGYILVGDFVNGAALIRRGGLRVEMVQTNDRDFELGLWTMRAYSRIGAMYYRTELFELAQLNPL